MVGRKEGRIGEPYRALVALQELQHGRHSSWGAAWSPGSLPGALHTREQPGHRAGEPSAGRAGREVNCRISAVSTDHRSMKGTEGGNWPAHARGPRGSSGEPAQIGQGHEPRANRARPLSPARSGQGHEPRANQGKAMSPARIRARP